MGPFKALYTSPPGRPVHSNTNSTSLGSIQPCCNYCAETTHSFISTSVYSQVVSERRQRGVDEIAQVSKRQQESRTPLLSNKIRRSNHCITAPLRHCTTAPLHHCATAPLRHCATAPLHHCTTAPLRHCATAPLRHCTTAPLHHCTTAPLHHCNTAPLHHCATAQLRH